MKLVTCPSRPDFSGDVPHLIFMAGGITGAPQWQKEFFSLVEDRIPDDFVLVNPRRPNFDVRDPSITEEQIKWEYEFLDKSSTVIFWFPKEAQCMITLYELGKELSHPYRRQNVLVGASPEYCRRLDIDHQVPLVAPHVEISDTMEDLAAQLIDRCHKLI